jgi:hypothetical protein
VKGTWETTDSGGGGIGAALGVIGAVLLVAAIAGPVVAAVAVLARLVVIIVIAAVALAAIGGGAAIVLRLRHGPPRAPQPRVYGSRSVHAMQDRPEPRALPARQELHLHFHGVGAEDVAVIIADQERRRL